MPQSQKKTRALYVRMPSGPDNRKNSYSFYVRRLLPLEEIADPVPLRKRAVQYIPTQERGKKIIFEIKRKERKRPLVPKKLLRRIYQNLENRKLKKIECVK